MRRIVAALTCALCGMPLTTAQVTGAGSSSSTGGVSASSSTGSSTNSTSSHKSAGSTGDASAQQQQALSDVGRLEQAHLAGAAFGVAGDCALVVSTWWDRSEPTPGEPVWEPGDGCLRSFANVCCDEIPLFCMWHGLK
jgi:hypothetical protein